MRKTNRWLILLILAAVEGLLALFMYFSIPSEAANTGFLGFSNSRWMVGVAVILVWLGLVTTLFYAFQNPVIWDTISQRFNRWLHEGSHVWAVRSLMFVILITCLEMFLLTYLSLPVHLRPLILWLGLVIIEGLIWSFWFFRKPIDLLAGWHSLDHSQRLVFWVLIGIGLILFIIFIPQNMQGVQDRHQLFMTGGDENITYPYIEWMLRFTGKPEEWIYGLVVYEDYHYGYPFYFLSALVVLPIRLIYGPNFGEQTLINMVLLRQMISSLPMLIASMLLVWMSTRFRSLWKSLILYLLLLSIPNAAFYNIRFWHPDSLVVLAVVFTLFFLSRDHYHLGWNFYAAAVACGLASAIKLYGFFFVLTILIYLLACYIDGKVNWRRLVISAILFVTAMTVTIILANPFLGVPSARERLIQIQSEKSGEISIGYNQPDPEYVYRLGLEAWIPFLERGFGPIAYLGFLVFSLVISSLWGKQKLNHSLVLSWFFVNAFYLINFSAVKSQHYWLPAMLPLYGAALNMVDLTTESGQERIKLPQSAKQILSWVSIIVAIVIIGINGYAARSIFTELIRCGF